MDTQKSFKNSSSSIDIILNKEKIRNFGIRTGKVIAKVIS